MTETTSFSFQKLYTKLRDISSDVDVTSIVQLLNRNHSLSHWQPIEYLPPDSDCPEILQSEHVIVDKLVKSELQTKFDQLKKQFSELSSFMQQNRDVVETLENLEKR
ncbi:hypothetical protein FBUS_05756 [Fasciolopsis buskii]|uniref:Uncharacterized protein n=1 Tax=Fasciolopsis buskii TaxID=27845 RepID=A0A8E0VS56_9TREM|nr:hypothetical protein FBUS_05756 [Fasciolopsis buski]